MSDPTKKYWLDEPRNVRRLYHGLIAVCGLLVALDLFYDKHGDFAWDNWIGFHGFYGFTVFFLIVLAGRPLRRLLMRDEDYYDR